MKKRKKGDPVRMEDAETFTKLYHKHRESDPAKAGRYLLRAKLSREFGWHNAVNDYLPKQGRPAGSGKRKYAAAVAWMHDHAAEYSGDYALGGACVDAGIVDLPANFNRKSVVETLVKHYRTSN